MVTSFASVIWFGEQTGCALLVALLQLNIYRVSLLPRELRACTVCPMLLIYICSNAYEEK